MNRLLLQLMGLTAAAAGTLAWSDLRGHTSGILLWAPKLISGALAPLVALAGAVLAGLGLRRRDPFVVGASLAGAVLTASYAARAAAPQAGFEQAFGPDWPQRIPEQQRRAMLSRRYTPFAPAPSAACVHNVPYGVHPETGQLLLADLWQPPAGVARSRLGVIYVHGGAWRMGEKDMGTGWIFRRLASQGHVIMDIDYTLAPASDVPGMVQDVKRAVIWLKRNGVEYGVDARRIVLMGASAGGHLALLAAYTANDPVLQPDGSAVDTALRGVVSFYGPADFLDMYQEVETTRARIAQRKRIRPYGVMVEKLLQRAGLAPADAPIEEAGNFIAELLGAEPDQDPDLYSQLSPVGRAGPHCPPTLLLQGTTDIFGMGPSVQRLHHALVAAGVASVLVEFPRTDHAFDLVLPQVSPVAQAATYDVERFLALLC
jgi:acetyl esterase/lipase